MMARKDFFEEPLYLNATILFGFAITMLIAISPMGGVLRFLLPVAAIVIATALVWRQKYVAYVTLALWLPLAVPFFRRVVDSRFGWTDPSPILLTTLIFLIPAGILQLASIFRTKKIHETCLLAIFCIPIYGLALGIMDGRASSSTVDCLRWSLPISLGSLVIAKQSRCHKMERNIIATSMFLIFLASIYAIFQYIDLPYWDVFWMVNVNMASIGKPEPFLVRVFGSASSPASLAHILVCGMLILLASRTVWRWPVLILGAISLGLTSVRTSWLGLAVGLILMLINAPFQIRKSIISVVILFGLFTPILLTIPEIQNLLVSRIESFSNLSGDESYIARQAQYVQFVDALDRNIGGLGFALRNSSNGSADSQAYAVIDGGFIELYMSLGIFVGTLYIAFLLLTGFYLFREGHDGSSRDFNAVTRIVFVVSVVSLVGGLATIGEGSFILWACIGTSLSQSAKARDEVDIVSCKS